MISDTDLMWSLLAAVGALAERITGEKLLVKIENKEQSAHVWTYPSSDMVRWVKSEERAIGQEVVEGPCVDYPGLSYTPL